ncbi:MAG: MmcQ/YjbR family DNA-binding protein [Myxococcales bacterium]|nr:MmcQ/YjbR family DNA-binding protein [Myxococcales bacterium]
MTWKQLVRLAKELPSVEEGIWYRTPSLEVRGKSFVRLKEDGESVVFILESVDAQQFLIQALPRIFFITPHYENWPAVLARLKSLTVKEARRRLADSWAQRAPKKLLAARVER